MPLLKVVSPLVVVGVVLWLLNPCIPMQSTIKTILNFVVVVAVIIRLIYGSFGIITRRDIAHDSVRMMPAPAVAQSPPQGVRARL